MKTENDKWVCVHRVSGIVNAHVIAGRFEAEGIPTKLQYEIAGVIYAVTIDGLGEVKILVPASYVTMAKSILAQRYDDNEDWWKES